MYHTVISRCPSLEQMLTILDGRVAELREFVGAVVKTLPRPRAIECAKEYLGLRKHVRLTFVCARGAGEPFVVEVCHGMSRICHCMS